MIEVPDPPRWHAEALCREYPKLSWFEGRGMEIADAKSVCRRWPVQDDCLQYALDNESLVGIWGGLTIRERRQLTRTVAVA